MSRLSRWSRIAVGVAGVLVAVIVFDRGVDHDVFRRAALSSLYHDARRWVAAIPAGAYDRDPAIVYWGDSLTAGSGATSGHDFPSLIAFLYHRRSLNLGVAGETSRQIRDRFLARAKPRGPEAVVIWAGRNNTGQPARIESDIRDMIDSLNPDSKFLEFGVISAADPGEQRGADEYDLIMGLNAKLAAAYGARFVPIHEILMAAGNRRLHLDDAGQAVVAAAVESAMAANGW